LERGLWLGVDAVGAGDLVSVVLGWRLRQSLLDKEEDKTFDTVRGVKSLHPPPC
jgi:hypothetical protein